MPTILKLLISVFSQVPKFNVTPHPWLQVLQNSIKPFVWGRGLVVVDVPCVTDDPTNILHSPSTQTFHILKFRPKIWLLYDSFPPYYSGIEPIEKKSNTNVGNLCGSHIDLLSIRFFIFSRWRLFKCHYFQLIFELRLIVSELFFSLDSLMIK